MTEAIVTDLAEYRARKEGSPLQSYSDAKLQTRYTVLEHVENGADYLTRQDNALSRMQWPRGFDPERHPEDNIDAVRLEAAKRGVTLT